MSACTHTHTHNNKNENLLFKGQRARAGVWKSQDIHHRQETQTK